LGNTGASVPALHVPHFGGVAGGEGGSRAVLSMGPETHLNVPQVKPVPWLQDTKPSFSQAQFGAGPAGPQAGVSLRLGSG